MKLKEMSIHSSKKNGFAACLCELIHKITPQATTFNLALIFIIELVCISSWQMD